MLVFHYMVVPWVLRGGSLPMLHRGGGALPSWWWRGCRLPLLAGPHRAVMCCAVACCRLPLYYEAKLAFIVLCWHPRAKLAVYLFERGLQPLLQANEARIDSFVENNKARAADLVASQVGRWVGVPRGSGWGLRRCGRGGDRVQVVASCRRLGSSAGAQEWGALDRRAIFSMKWLTVRC